MPVGRADTPSTEGDLPAVLEPMLVETPSLYPHMCIDGTQDSPVVDACLRAGNFGRVYLSRRILRDSTRLMPEIVEELAGEIGWVAPEMLDEALKLLDGQLADSQAKVAELEGRLAELESVERALERAAAKVGLQADDEPVRPRARSRRGG